ncbi:hypothetical protein D3C81_606070 [compost metagenome]
MQIKLTDATPPGPVRMAVFGLSGMGKTLLAATGPKPLIFNGEKGLLSLSPANIAKVYGENQSWVTYNVPYIDFASIQELRDLFQWLQTEPALAYKSIFIDSASDVAEIVLAEALGVHKDGRQAYGAMGTDMLNLVRSFRDLPTHHHIIFLCKAEKFTDDVTGSTNVGMKFPGKMLQSGMPYLLDEVFALEAAANGARQIRTKANWQYQCKDRSGMLDELEYPSIAHILAKMGHPL